MKHNTWKMIAIVLMAVVGLFIVLAIVPGFVVLVTTPHIINVDTNSQWISFWGNYLGALTGGILGIAGAVFVLKETLKDNRQEIERGEILSFCDYLIRKSSEYAQKCQSCLYKLVEYKNKDGSEKYSGDVKLQLLKDFLEMHHSGKIALYELQQNLEIRGATMIYQTVSSELVQKECLELIDVYDKIEENIVNIKENDEIFNREIKNISNKLNGFMKNMNNYEKELFEKVVK